MNYKKLYEQHARAEKIRAVGRVIGGVLGIIGGIGALKALHDEVKPKASLPGGVDAFLDSPAGVRRTRPEKG